MKQLLDLQESSNSRVVMHERENGPDIAVIGIGLRIGDCFTADKFWQSLKEKRDFVTSASDKRKRDTAEIIDTKGFEFLELAYMQDYDHFDCGFFRIPPNKACLMDPQEKILLQTAVQAVEDAGYGLDMLAGTQTGVFIGGKGSFSVYESAIKGLEDSNTLLELLTPAMTAARISHFMNLKGAATVVDTACSSSLAALHNACLAIKENECSLALVGASNLVLAPLGNGRRTEIESNDGRTRAFDRESTGTGGGEACVVVLIKSLDKAVKDRDSIYALIKGSAMNQNGRSTDITAPDAEAQADVIRLAWQAAGIDPCELSFIEAHGTGTKLGDVVEIEGLTKAFANYTDKKGICPVGSVKSNAGHTDNVAGLLSLVKAVLAIKNREFPGTVHFKEPNPEIDFGNAPVYPTGDNTLLDTGTLVGGISSFGLSGTNVHTVIQTATRSEQIDRPKPPYIFALSAKSNGALRRMIANWIDFITKTELHPADISYTLLTGRDHHEHRVAFLYNDNDQLAEILNRLDSSERPISVAWGVHRVVRDYRKEESAGISPQKREELGQKMREKLEDGDWKETLNLYISGALADFKPFFRKKELRRVHLPVYSFEPSRYWFKKKKEGRFSFFEHEVISTGRYSVFRSFAGAPTSWLFRDHKVGGKSVLPGSSILDQAFDLAEKTYGSKPKLIKDLRLHHFFEVPEDQSEIVVNVQPEGQGKRCLLEYCFNGQWSTVAEWLMEPTEDNPGHVANLDIRHEFPVKYASDEDFIPGLDGVVVSDKWRCLEYAGEGKDGSGAILSVPAEHRATAEQYFCYPPVGDIGTNFNSRSRGCTPWLYSKIRVFGRVTTKCLAFSRLKKTDDKYACFDIQITDTKGRIIVDIEDYTMLRLPSGLADYYHIKQWVDEGEYFPDKSGQPVAIFYGGEPDEINSDNVRPVCWSDTNVPEGVEAISEKELPEFLQRIYADGVRRMVYVLPDDNQEPEQVLERLFLFLSAVASGRDGEIELIIAGRERSSLLHSAAAGMGRVLELERPSTRFCLVSIEDESLKGLFFLLPFPGFRLRLVEGRVQSLQLKAGYPGDPIPVEDGGRYLITGGLGGIGLFLGDYISERVKGEIIFVTRSGFPSEKEWDHLLALGGRSAQVVQKLRRINEKGCRIKTVAADVSSRDQMLNLRKEFGSFDGIFHFAGTAEDKFLSAGHIQGFTATLAPKVRGTKNITEVFADSGFIVLASSLSALTGATGQAGYVAANAFMDSLAEHSLEQVVYSIGWPEWIDTGMAVKSDGPLYDPFASIRSSEAAMCLDNMPRSRYTAVGRNTEPNRFLLMEGEEVRLNYLAAGYHDKLEEVSFVDLNGASEFTKTQQIIASVWGDELGYESLDVYDDYKDLGGNSISSLMIHDQLQKLFGLRISFNELFRMQTVADMADYIDRLLFIRQRGLADKNENTLLLREDGEWIVFCFPPGTAYGYAYYDLARLLPGYTIYAFNYVKSDAPPETLANMLEELQPEGEIILLGYSIGGNLAYDTALVLERRGRKISALIFIDNYRRLELLSFSDEEYRKNAEEYLVMVDERYLRSENREFVLEAIEHYDRYMDSRMETESVNAPIHLIKGEDKELDLPYKMSQQAWQELTPEFIIHQGSGQHLEMLSDQHLEKNVDQLNRILVGL